MTRRLGGATAVAVVVLAALAGPISGPTGAAAALAPTAPPASPVADAYGRQVFRETALRRDRADLTPLARNRCLQAAALAHATRMARAGALSEPDRGEVRRECDLRRVFVAVAGGFPNGRATVRGWMRDPQARATVLHRRVGPAGAAARIAQDDTWFAVLLVGRPKPAA